MAANEPGEALAGQSETLCCVHLWDRVKQAELSSVLSDVTVELANGNGHSKSASR
ncbi:MAG: hypothetical protein U0361_12105 [Nitrospiraceae bacterium]